VFLKYSGSDALSHSITNKSRRIGNQVLISQYWTFPHKTTLIYRNDYIYGENNNIILNNS